jgi:hypothetical protein
MLGLMAYGDLLGPTENIPMGSRATTLLFLQKTPPKDWMDWHKEKLRACPNAYYWKSFF